LLNLFQIYIYLIAMKLLQHFIIVDHFLFAVATSSRRRNVRLIIFLTYLIKVITLFKFLHYFTVPRHFYYITLCKFLYHTIMLYNFVNFKNFTSFFSIVIIILTNYYIILLYRNHILLINKHYHMKFFFWIKILAKNFFLYKWLKSNGWWVGLGKVNVMFRFKSFVSKRYR